MKLHLLSRLHSAAHWLFEPKDERAVRALYTEVSERFVELGIDGPTARDAFITELALEVATRFGLDESDGRATLFTKTMKALMDGEVMFFLPEPDWLQKRTIAQRWELRDVLSYQKSLTDDFESTCHLAKQLLGLLVQQIHEVCPALYAPSEGDEGLIVETHLQHAIGDPAVPIEGMLEVAFAEGLVEAGLFNGLRNKLEANLVGASGGNPNDPASFSKAPRYPSQYDAKSPEHLIHSYLGGTPLADLFDQRFDFAIPLTSRFEHHHIVAGSGHGKTQALQYLIANDLDAVARGERSVVVIDSQNDLINTISNLAVFAQGGALHDRLVIIDPSDVEYPLSLNLFDVGIDRLGAYGQLERERLTNSILELYDFVLGSLLDAEMTQKQSVIFRYVTRLMLHIPGATIHTLRDLMEPRASTRFANHIAKLSGSARHFFASEFDSKEFEQTKRQVLRRLWGILENQTFERMFTHPKSKLDLFAEMNAGKVILISTAKDLLKEQGSELFGRFFIAMIAQAAQERATLPEEKRKPTMVYVDEAADYFDRNIGIILAQARKYKVGMVLAHQFLGQLDTGLQEGFSANTAIKFAGGVSTKDARALSSMMGCSPEFLERQPNLSFAAHVRGVTKSGLPLQFPYGFMEDLPRMSADDRWRLQDTMRSCYAMPADSVNVGGYTNAREGAERVDEKERGGGDDPSPAEPQRQEGRVDTKPGSSW
ncbi:MAG: type IV secretory system conjugative DNA transfer family protein [Erythrobacter sp.]